MVEERCSWCGTKEAARIKEGARLRKKTFQAMAQVISSDWNPSPNRKSAISLHHSITFQEIQLEAHEGLEGHPDINHNTKEVFL